MRIQLFIPRVWKIAAYTAKSFQLWFYRSCFVFRNNFCPPPCLLVSLELSLKDMMQESERTNSIFMFSFSWKNVTFKKKKKKVLSWLFFAVGLHAIVWNYLFEQVIRNKGWISLFLSNCCAREDGECHVVFNWDLRYYEIYCLEGQGMKLIMLKHRENK